MRGRCPGGTEKEGQRKLTVLLPTSASFQLAHPYINMSRFLSSLLPKAKPDSYIPLDTHDIPHPTSPSPSRPSRRGRIPSLLRTHGPLVYILVLHGLIIALILRSHHNPFRTPPPPPPTPPPAAPQTPALDLTPEGLAKFGVEALYERQSRTLRQATARYELKTGRKTPRGFAKWFEWVSERGLLVDEYDQVSRVHRSSSSGWATC